MDRDTTLQCTPEQEQLTREHLPLVHHVVNAVRQRIPGFVPLDDLESAAMFGLYQASRSYDPSHGVPFEHWARRRMEGEVIDELRSRDWAGRTVRTDVKRVRRAVDELTQRLGRSPRGDEVAHATAMDAERLRQVRDQEHTSVILNLDSVFTMGDSQVVVAGTAPDAADALLRRETEAYLRDAVVSLPDRLRRVIVGYYFEELPMCDLAGELGVSESRISQMRAEAVALLREGLQSQLEPSEHDGPAPTGRIARRKAAYFAAIAAASNYHARLEADPPSVPERVAQRAEAIRLPNSSGSVIGVR